jgi:pilus assembly protein CpaE
MAHEIILVSELSLAGIRDTLRIKNAIASLGGAAGLTMVTSRVSATHSGQVDQTSFEKGAQIKVNYTIPEDPKSVATSANTGKALGAVAPDAPITKALLNLAAKLSGKDAGSAGKGGWWNWIWGSPSPAKTKDGKSDTSAAKEKS